MPHPKIQYRSLILWLGSMLLVILLLASCGGSATTSAPTTNAAVKTNDHQAASNASGQSTSGQNDASTGQKSATSAYAAQLDLIRTLNVTMQVQNTRTVADDLQTWITTTDPHSISAGTDYEEVGTNLYNITLTYSVAATSYPKVYQHLRDYTAQKGGDLTAFTETVQDVTGDYVDTQSRIKNMQGEQTRLLSLMSSAQNLSDVITIEQQLTTVEGQIETDEAHLNLLNSEVTYYTVSITLQPASTATPLSTNNGWSFGQTVHNAFVASVSFGQALLTFIIWLLAFSLYIIPVLVIAWGVRRWRTRSHPAFPHSTGTPKNPPESL